jgi:hypothetical protein
MATMGCYCKAYPIGEFRRYARWSEKAVAKPPEPIEAAPAEAASEEPEEPYLFLQENLTVTDGVMLDEYVVFDDVTPEWEAFCREQLQFEVPAWCREEVAPFPAA